MRSMPDPWRTVPAAAAALGLCACVTINIYFPAAAAEKAADKIIDEVWQLQKQEGAKPDHAVPAPVTPSPSEPKQ